MQFLRMLFTWWHSQTLGTALTTWRHGELVGMDEQGNRYYRDKNGKSINGKTRRWVVYNGDVEATRVPPEWHGWLHYTVDETPEEAGFEKKTGISRIAQTRRARPMHIGPQDGRCCIAPRRLWLLVAGIGRLQCRYRRNRNEG